MSDSDRAPVATPEGTPPPPPNGCLTALMILAGIVLLLPGLCSLVVGGMMLTGGGRISEFGGIFLITFLIAAGGIMLISAGVRRPRR